MKSDTLPFVNKAFYFVTSPEDLLVIAGVCGTKGGCKRIENDFQFRDMYSAVSLASDLLITV